jgi:hypothetical protein
MEKIADLFGKRTKLPRQRRQTERGDIFDSLLSGLNPARARDGYSLLTHKRLAFLLQGIPTKDLYALISKMDDGARRGVPAGAIFWSEIRPSKKSL